MKKLLLAIGLLIMGVAAAQQPFYSDEYVVVKDAPQTQYGKLSITATDYQPGVLAMFMPTSLNLEQAYEGVYKERYAQLAISASNVVERKMVDYKGYMAMEVKLHKSDVTPEQWNRIVVLRDKLYTISYTPDTIADVVNAEYERITNNAVQMVEVAPASQYMRLNFKGTRRVLLEILIATIVFSIFGVAYTRWDKKNKMREEARELGRRNE